MKIRYNLPKINKLKQYINTVKERIKNNKMSNEKIGYKYYLLLILMVTLGVISISINYKKYREVSKEDYTEYTLPDTSQAETKKMDVTLKEKAISSISTNVASALVRDKPKEDANNKYIMPIEGKIIKEYAMDKLVYSKTLDMWKTHPGIDISCEIGTDVKAVEDGKVTKIEKSNFYGNTIYISHDNGYVSMYANLADSINVKEGQNVVQGEVITQIGVSAGGEIQDESHLHFEILKGEEQISPLELINKE